MPDINNTPAPEGAPAPAPEGAAPAPEGGRGSSEPAAKTGVSESAEGREGAREGGDGALRDEVERLKREVEELRREMRGAAGAPAAEGAPGGGPAAEGAPAADPDGAPAEGPAAGPDALPAAGPDRGPAGKPAAARARRIAGEAALYVLLVLLVATTVVVKAGSNGSPISIAGFSAMIVVSESMQSEIPKGSLVVTKAVDPGTLEIGDDITYMAGRATTVTHRIVGIVEDYEGTGERAFVTQGVMNSAADSQPVAAANVVGKVVFHSEALGIVLGFVSSYWPVLVMAAAVLALLACALRRISREPP